MIDLDLPLSQMTPAQRVTWSVVAAGIYATHQVRLQYVDKRWGLIPKSDWKSQPPRILHICRPLKIYWGAKNAYRIITCQFEVPAGRIKGPFKVGIETQPWGPASSAEKISVTMNGFTTLNHDALAWVTEWDCCKLPEGHTFCPRCQTDAPPAALGVQKFMNFGEKV